MLIIKNGTIITLDSKNKTPVIENGFVAIKGSNIEEVGSGKIPKKYDGYDEIDARGKIVMPGFINTHHHCYSAFARGGYFGNKPNKNFVDILENVWWKIDRKLTLLDTKYSAYMTFIESILNGVTTVIDHHASFGSIRGSLMEMSSAASDVGLRASLCYETSDRDGKKKFEDSVAENIEFIKYAKEKKSKLLSAMFGLHASFTLSNDSLKKCKNEVSKVGDGFHVHVAEDIADVHDSLRQSGCRVVERLFNYGILGDKTLAIHCIHTNEAEHQLLKKTNTSVVTAPESNMSNAVGTAPLMKLFESQVLVGLGSDGYTSDMLESLKNAMCIQRHNNCDSNIGFPQIPNMLLENNREIAKKQFDTELGILKPKAAADIVILDYTPYTPLTKNNVLGHTLFGLSGRQASTVIIAGNVILKNREFVNIDIKEIAAKSKELAQKLWAKL